MGEEENRTQAPFGFLCDKKANHVKFRMWSPVMAMWTKGRSQVGFQKKVEMNTFNGNNITRCYLHSARVS